MLHNADDLLLLEHLEVAHRAAERHTHRTVSPQVTRTLQLRDFPLVACPLKFDFPPLISVEQISYFDQDDASQTIASSQYRVIPQTDGVGFVEFDDDYSTPTVSWRPDAVTISYTSGYGERGDIPETIKHGILMYVEYLYTGDESQREGAERIWDSECYGIYA